MQDWKKNEVKRTRSRIQRSISLLRGISLNKVGSA
nr:MAG TPA: hypothetical protein [Caudoviricetes sp.]